MAAGFVSVPVVPTFKGMSKEFSERLEKPAKLAGERAGEAMSEGLGATVENFEKQVAASSGKLEKFSREVEKSKDKLTVAEKKHADALEASKNRQKDYNEAVSQFGEDSAKARRAKERWNDAETRTVELEQKRKNAESDVEVALKKRDDQQKDLTRTTEKYENAQDELADSLGMTRKELDSLEAEFSDLDKSIEQSAQKARGFGGKLMDGLREVGKGALLGIGAKIGTTIMSGVQSAMADGWRTALDLDKVSRSLSAMTSSTEVAKDMMSDLREVAGNMPVDYTSFLEAANTLAYMGYEGEDAVKVLENVATAAVGAGNDGSEAIESAAGALGKMQANGKVTQEEIATISANGIPVLDMLIDHFGMTAGSYEQLKDMISEGNVELDDVFQALGDSGSETFQKLADSAENMNGSLEAQWSILRDDLNVAIGEALLPVLQEMDFEKLGESLGTLAEKLVEIVPKVIDIVTVIADNLDWILPLGATLAAIAGGIWLINAALAANPLVLIWSSITAVIAALMIFFAKTETGQELWSRFTDVLKAGWDKFVGALQWAWENIIQPVWNGMASVATWLWNTVLVPAFEGIKAGFELAAAGIQWAWENLIKPAWDALSGAAQWLWNNVLMPVFESIKNGFQALGDGISWVYENLIKPVWDKFSAGIRWLWENAVQPVIGWIGAKWKWLQNLMNAAWIIIRDFVIQPFMDKVQELWADWVQPILGFIGDKWDWLSTQMQAGWTWIDEHVFTPFKNGLKRLESFFGTVVDGIRSVWNGLKAALAEPINFMIRTVYNNGIANAWDTIAKFLPLEPKTAKRLDPIGGYATGGAIRGKGTGTSDDILAWLSNGEHVWTAQDVRNIGGQSAMYAMRDALKHGRGFTFDGENLALLPHVDSRVGDLEGAAPGLFPQGAFAGGGEVRPMWELQLEKGHRWAKARHGRPYVLGGSADGGGGTDCSGFMSGIADVMGGGSGARQWATMAFNGGGNQQYSSGPQGFVAGLKAHTFSIGVTNGGAAGGHTAGTLGATSRVGAVNVESGGSPSMVKYGTGAVGANDSYFTTHYHLPIGPGGAFEIGKGSGGPSPDMMRAYVSKKVEGAIDKIMGPIANRLPSGPPVWEDIPRGVYDKGKKSMADKTADVVANLGDRLSTVFTAAQEVGDIVRDGARGVMELAGRAIGLHDQGGWLQDGNLALNLSGKPEPVLTDAQWASVSEMVKSIGDLVPAIEGQTKAIAKAVDDTQAWLFKAGDYNSIEGINARQGVRRVLDLGIDLPGTDVINSVLDGEDALWDSRARAAKNMDTIIEKEKALEEARQAVADLRNAPKGISEDEQKKLDDAKKARDDAKAEQAKAASEAERAKAAEKVAKAEQTLNDVRAEVDKNSQENAQKHAEEVTKANEAVSKAEQELVAARKQQATDLDNIVLVSQQQVTGLIPMAEKFADQLVSLGAPAAAVGAGLAQVTGGLSAMAAFIGPAGITLGMALDMLKIAISIAKTIIDAIKKVAAWVKEIVGKVRQARLDALEALADGWAVIADYAGLVVDLQGKVTTLQQALIRGANEQREAEYNLMVAQHDRYIAEAEGALKVAEARLALDEEIRRGATAAQLKMMGLHEDWDSYMAYQALEAQGVLEEWSDAAISALFTYEKARAEALKGEVEARLDQIEAEAALAEAQRQNVRNQQDLLKAQERLIRMSARVAGVDLEDATGTAEIAKLMAEMAEVRQAMDKNTLGRVGDFLRLPGSRSNEYRGQRAHYDSLQQALFAVAGATGANIDQGNLDRTLKLMGRASYRGGDPMDVLRARMPELVQAETALQVNESMKPIYEARDQRDDLARQVEDFTAEIGLYEKTSPLEHTLEGLDYTIASLEKSSQAWADGSEELRGEYLAAAKANRDAAESAGVDWKLDSKYANAGVRDQIRRETTIHLDGEKMYTANQIDQLLAEVTAGTNGSYRIVRSASEVAVSRRKERV